MNCRKCGRRIKAADKYCVYCGESTGSLPLRLLRRTPTWSKLLSFVVIAGIAAVLAFYFFVSPGATSSDTGVLELHTGLDGVSVFVDEEWWASTDPSGNATISGLSPGVHSITLTKSGYQDWTGEVEVVSKQTVILDNITLQKDSTTVVPATASGTLMVYVGVAGVRVQLGSIFDGETDASGYIEIKAIPEGTYSLKLTKSGYKDLVLQVTIEAGKTTPIFRVLEQGTGTSQPPTEPVTPVTRQGTLVVNTNPGGVSISLDDQFSGQTNGSGYAPVNGVNEGLHTLKLSRDNYKTWTKQVNITASNATTVYAYLESGIGVATTRNETISSSSVLGTLEVHTASGGVAVWVGGEFGGTTDANGRATVNGLIAGTYSLRLTASGCKEWTKQVSISGSQSTTVYAYMESGTGTAVIRNETISSSSALGTLVVNAVPGSVAIWVGGEFGGTTNATSGSATVNGLIAGTYSLQLTAASGYKEWTKQVSITGSQTTTVYAYIETGTGLATTRAETISATSAMGMLDVRTVPVGAAVWVGGEYGGTTDTSGRATVNGLIEGTYTLRLTVAGYKEWTKSVSITGSQTTTVYAYLESGTGVATTRTETISATSAMGMLDVRAVPGSVDIWVGGEFGGTTDAAGNGTVNGLLQGTYTLRLTAVGYKEWAKQVSISGGQTATVYAYLEAGSGIATTRAETISATSPMGTLSISATSGGVGVVDVQIFISDEFGGMTSASGSATVNGLLAGTYTVRLTRTGYLDWTGSVTITAGQVTDLSAGLIVVVVFP